MHIRTRTLVAGLTVVCVGVAGLVWALLASAATPRQISSDRETVPGSHGGDSIDDPAIWVNPSSPRRSLVIANDKHGALNTYDLNGHLVQRLSFGSRPTGNVDVLQGASIGGRTRALVGMAQGGIRFYTVNTSTRRLSSVTEGGAPISARGEGFCMYRSRSTHRVYAFVVTIAGKVTQVLLRDTDSDGLLEGRTVRRFSVGSEAEGCAADNDTGALYISEENKALWRYHAEPRGGTSRRAVDVLTRAGGHLRHDIEGVTVVNEPHGSGYVIVSAQSTTAQGPSYFAVYGRGRANDFVKTFRIAGGRSSDDCDHTDGVAATTAFLGSAFPRGLFVCQDDKNQRPGTRGHQDLKLTRLDHIVHVR